MYPDNKGGFGFKRLMPYEYGFEGPFEGEAERDMMLLRYEYKKVDIWNFIKDPQVKKEFENLYGWDSSDKEQIIKVFKLIKKSDKVALFTENIVLSYKNWDYNWLPYFFHRWDLKQTGMVGTGPAELVTPGQRKINGMLYRIDKSIELHTRHYVVFPKNSDFQNMSNGLDEYYEANIGAGTTARPFHATPPILHEQNFMHLNDTFEMTLKVARVNAAKAEGNIPKGLSQPSGRALAYYDEIDSSRFFSVISNYEESFVDIAQKVIEWGCDLYAKESKLFKEIKMEKEHFMKSVNKFPGSLLPETPSGRYQVLAQLVELELISREKFFELLDSPDISGFIRSESARISAVEKYLEKKFYENKPCSPDPTLGYEFQQEIAKKIFARISEESSEGWNDEKLDNIRAFLKIVNEKLEIKKMAQVNNAVQGIIPPTPNIQDQKKVGANIKPVKPPQTDKK